MTRLLKRYGYITAATYVAVYVVSLSSVYGIVSLGIIPILDVNSFVNGLSLKKWILGDAPVDIPRWASPLVTAWIITKTTEPVRLVVTAAIMPSVIKRLPVGILRFFGVKDKHLSGII